jgi:hypothetical protein
MSACVGGFQAAINLTLDSQAALFEVFAESLKKY